MGPENVQEAGVHTLLTSFRGTMRPPQTIILKKVALNSMMQAIPHCDNARMGRVAARSIARGGSLQ